MNPESYAHSIHVSAVTELTQPWQEMFSPEVFDLLAKTAKAHILSLPFPCCSLVTAVPATFAISTRIQTEESKYDSGTIYAIIVGESNSGKSVCHNLIVRDGIANVKSYSPNETGNCESYTTGGLQSLLMSTKGKLFISYHEGSSILQALRYHSTTLESEKGLLNKGWDRDGESKIMVSKTRVIEKIKCSIQGNINMISNLMSDMSLFHSSGDVTYVLDAEGSSFVEKCITRHVPRKFNLFQNKVLCHIHEYSSIDFVSGRDDWELASSCDTKKAKQIIRLAVSMFVIDQYFAVRLSGVNTPVNAIPTVLPSLYISLAQEMYAIFAGEKTIYLNGIPAKQIIVTPSKGLTNKQKMMKKIVAHPGPYIRMREFRTLNKSVSSGQVPLILKDFEKSDLGWLIANDASGLKLLCKMKPESLEMGGVTNIVDADFTSYRHNFYNFVFEHTINAIKFECQK